MNKMDNYTVGQLKTIAKERGIRGYFKLRNVEFIQPWKGQDK